jgi:ADP-ribose pyrophosphatase
MKEATSRLAWEEVSRKEEMDCRIFKVLSSRRRSFAGKEATFFLLDAPDWVTVVPLVRNSDGEDCFVMVRQYRHGSMSITLEFPAGTAEKGEEPHTTAARELIEETGYRAGSLIPLGSVSPNPAFMNNTMHTFLATDCTDTRVQSLDEHESVDVELVPVKEVKARMGYGEYSNGIMLIALSYYERRSGGEKNA